ncbi:MAG: 4-alpha-glucanotransferase [Thermoanaerobaculia bacterium]
MPPRSAGLLLHLTSLPSRFGIGDLGPTADAMLDWMLSAGLSVWRGGATSP